MPETVPCDQHATAANHAAYYFMCFVATIPTNFLACVTVDTMTGFDNWISRYLKVTVCLKWITALHLMTKIKSKTASKSNIVSALIEHIV